MEAALKKQLYGTTQSGAPIHEYTLSNANQVSVQIINYGGIITSVSAPDRAGVVLNVALGLPSLLDYETHNPYFGCIAGRYANRIARGRFTLDGKTYQLAINNGVNHLHGGLKGFDKQVWQVTREISGQGEEGIELRYVSPDGEENFPGTLDTHMTYTLNSNNELRIDYHARTDAPTVLNLTNHSLWNLAGEGSGTVTNHFLQLNADRYIPVDEGAIPYGELAPVDGTPFDFRKAKRIADEIRSDHPQVVLGKGYDHNWVINHASEAGAAPVKAGELSDPASGRCMEIWTTQPGIQVYSGNFLDGSNYGPSRRAYRMGDGLALETQHYPDSPNQPAYPSTLLRPGEDFRSTTIYKFGVQA
jgi:aldose 1-epimerase